MTSRGAERRDGWMCCLLFCFSVTLLPAIRVSSPPRRAGEDACIAMIDLTAEEVRPAVEPRRFGPNIDAMALAGRSLGTTVADRLDGRNGPACAAGSGFGTSADFQRALPLRS